MISNIPKGMVTDQFGMIGLLTFIRAAETEPNLVTLALGRSVKCASVHFLLQYTIYQNFALVTVPGS